jgi:hypothetical protein
MSVCQQLRKHTQTNNVKDLPRSGRPLVTADRDDRALQRLVRWMPFATSPVLKQHWLPQLHEAETDSRLTNGSCAMSLNSNHVVLNAMPNMIVDVGLPTVDV